MGYTLTLTADEMLCRDFLALRRRGVPAKAAALQVAEFHGVAETRALAASIAASGPLAIRGAKRIMSVRSADGFTAARALSDALRHALEWSRDVDEGMAAHREGRPPRFTGR